MTVKPPSDRALEDAAMMWHTNKVYEYCIPLNCGVNLPIGFTGVDEGTPLKEPILEDISRKNVEGMASHLYCTFDLPITEKHFVSDAITSFRKCQAIPERLILNRLPKETQKEYAISIFSGELDLGECSYLTKEQVRIRREKPKGFQ